jgi:hypothetical protein
VAALERMHEAAASMIRGDGTIALVGDICPDVESRPLAGFLALGAVLFGRPDWKRREAFTEHALWYLGMDGLAAWERLETRPGGAVVAAHFPQGGFAFLGGAEPAQVHVTLHSDPRGERLFHGDDDPLGVAVWAEGRDIVVDGGNVSYNPDEWRAYFRSAAAQSTVTLEGLAPWVESRYRGWFGPEYEALTSALEVGVKEGQPFAEAEHTGYHRLPSPVALRRRVTLAGPSVVVTDRLEGAGVASAEIRFHLGPGQVSAAGGAVVLAYADERIAELRSSGPAGVTLGLDESWVAPAYGVKRRGRVVCVRYRGPLPAEITTTIRVLGGPEPCRC